MQRLLAITWLTWKAALRFRLFWVMATLLLGAVILLPLVIKDDGTARGFTQILLTYTLSVVTALLGMSTLWLSCGTLARDIEDNQMQMVAVKPVPRWQIWLGKWLGLVTLNAVLLALAGIAIFVLLQWRAQKLPAQQQRILHEEVLVARESLKEKPADIEAQVERYFAERTKDAPVNPANAAVIKNQIREQLKVDVVRPRTLRRWKIDLGWRQALLRNEPLFARFKFYAASTNELGTYRIRVETGAPDSPGRHRLDATFAANAFHEIRLEPNSWDSAGVLTVDIANYDEVVIVFPSEDGFEILYREGGFGLNFIRALAIVLFWLALLAAIGLAAASFLSFPVAAFVSASLMIVALSTGTMASSVESGTVGGVNEETGERQQGVATRVLDVVLLPLFRALVEIFKLVQGFSPVDALSTGRSVTWGTVGLAFLQIVVLLGGLTAVFGIAAFSRRELAATHSQS
jgi:ABC-type transport system involved in multi-copper enzyme maturation permease subunit